MGDAALHESLPGPWRQLLRRGDMSGAEGPNSITDGLDQAPLVEGRRLYLTLFACRSGLSSM
jgi:hypothetical protein